MSTLEELRAYDRARQEAKRAKRKLEISRMQATHYRGVKYDIPVNPRLSSPNATLTYRGVSYKK